MLLGTKGYAAPEQYGFGSSTTQSDIYALGILFKEMLSSIDNGDLAFLVISELEKLNKDRLKECIGSSSLNLIIENWLEQGSLV